MEHGTRPYLLGFRFSGVRRACSATENPCVTGIIPTLKVVSNDFRSFVSATSLLLHSTSCTSARCHRDMDRYPTQRGLATQDLIALYRRLQRRIMAQALMIVEVLVALVQSIHTLAKQTQLGMFDQPRIPWIVQHPVEHFEQSNLPIGLAQQQHAIAGFVSATVPVHFRFRLSACARLRHRSQQRFYRFGCPGLRWSPPCAGRCRRGTRPALCRRRRPGSRVHIPDIERGRTRRPGCRTPGNDGTPAQHRQGLAGRLHQPHNIRINLHILSTLSANMGNKLAPWIPIKGCGAPALLDKRQ